MQPRAVKHPLCFCLARRLLGIVFFRRFAQAGWLFFGCPFLSNSHNSSCTGQCLAQAPVPAAAAHVRFCQGYQGDVCIFGAKKKRAKPNGPSCCIFCDPKRLNEAFLQQADTVALKKRFSRLDPEQRVKALGRVRRGEDRNLLCAAGSKFCQGYQGDVCIFGANKKRAEPNGPSCCIFCDPKRLNEAFLQQADSVALKKRFSRLDPEQRQTALGRVQREGYRNWLRATGMPLVREAESPAVPKQAAYRHTHDKDTDPYSEEELTGLYERGRKMWAEALAARRPLFKKGFETIFLSPRKSSKGK